MMAAVVSAQAHHAARVPKGTLHHERLADVWPACSPSQRSALLSLLHDFDLAYDVPGMSMSIVPAMLEDTHPSLVEAYFQPLERARDHEASCAYVFELVADDLWARLVAELAKWCVPLACSASRAVVQHGGEQALVLLNSEDRTVTVTARGQAATAMRGAVHDRLWQVARTVAPGGQGVVKRVEGVCGKAGCGDRARIGNAKGADTKMIRCPNCDSDVNVCGVVWKDGSGLIAVVQNAADMVCAVHNGWLPPALAADARRPFVRAVCASAAVGLRQPCPAPTAWVVSMADPTAAVATTEDPAGTPLHWLPVCQHVDGWHVVCRSSPSLPPYPPARVTDSGTWRSVAQALVVSMASSGNANAEAAPGSAFVSGGQAAAMLRLARAEAADTSRHHHQHSQPDWPTIHTACGSPLTHVTVRDGTELWMCSDHSGVHAHSSFEAEVLPRLPPTAAASWSAVSASSKVRLHRGKLEAGDGVTDTMAKYLFDRGCTKVSSDGMEVREVVTVKCPDAVRAFALKVHKLVQRYDGMATSASHPFHAAWTRRGRFHRGDMEVNDTPAHTKHRHATLRKLQHDHVNMAASWVGAGSSVTVHIMYHAVQNEETARKILDGGFAALQTLDPGWYGRGVYLSHSLKYPCTVYGSADDDGVKTVLACAVVMGNPYPVLPKEGPSGGWEDGKWPACPESITNQPTATRHDAHVTYVKFAYDPAFDPHGPKPAGHLLPVEQGDLGQPWAVSEVVIPDESQVLPLAMLKVKNV